MSATAFFIALGLLVLYIAYKQTGQLPIKQARGFLEKGALVIDVRTPAEYDTGHLSQSVNIPLDTIEGVVASRVRNRSQVLLLHCQSGFRSKTAVKRLQGLGYKNAFNMGSYARAFNIVSGKKL